MQMAIAENKAELRALTQTLRAGGKSLAFVPTMGALHDGHMQLVREAKKHADAVVASIFVNPKQFGPNEDYARYPRTLDQDKALLEREGASILYLPSVEDMYAAGFATNVHVSGVSEGLCGAARPGHFDGVALVVAKLLLQAGADVALFGEKDYQQLCVIRRMVADLDIPVEIIGVPTHREEDGLAMSSRNRYLSKEERAIAPLLAKTLREAADYLRQHPFNVDNALSLAAYNLTHHGFTKLDYIELRAENSLTPLPSLTHPARLLAAAWLGNTRLIDNVPVVPDR